MRRGQSFCSLTVNAMKAFNSLCAFPKALKENHSPLQIPSGPEALPSAQPRWLSRQGRNMCGINSNETAGKDQSIMPTLQTLLIIITAVISALTKLTKNIHKDFKKLSCFIHRRQKVLTRTIKIQPLDIPIREECIP